MMFTNAVRRSLQPHAVPKDWAGVIFNGIRKCSKDVFERELGPFMKDRAVCMSCFDDSVLVVAIYDVDLEAGDVSISWAYSRRRRGIDDPLFSPYSAKRDKSPVELELWDELENLPELAEPFSYIFRKNGEMRNDKIIHHQLVTLLVPLKDLLVLLEASNVVLIGDAVHGWTNHTGTSGNAAIVDGITLGEMLLTGKSGTDFYEVRYSMWEKELAQAGQAFESLHRPRSQWLELLQTRTEKWKTT